MVKTSRDRCKKLKDRHDTVEAQHENMYCIGDEQSRGEREELYKLLSATGAEAKDVVKVKEEMWKEVSEAEKKKEDI